MQTFTIEMDVSDVAFENFIKSLDNLLEECDRDINEARINDLPTKLNNMESFKWATLKIKKKAVKELEKLRKANAHLDEFYSETISSLIKSQQMDPKETNTETNAPVAEAPAPAEQSAPTANAPAADATEGTTAPESEAAETAESKPE